MELEERHYDELILEIIHQGQLWFAELGLDIFPEVLNNNPEASTAEIADVYTSAIQSRLRGSVQ